MPTDRTRHLISETEHTPAPKPPDQRAAIAETAGVLTGMYGDGYLDDLRDEWPS